MTVLQYTAFFLINLFTVLEKTSPGRSGFYYCLNIIIKKKIRPYPFEYLIKVKYTLKKGGRLYLETTVKNLSSRAHTHGRWMASLFQSGGRS